MKKKEDHRTPSERLRDEGKIEDAVVELVRERDWVSFVEVERFLGEDVTGGHFAITLTSDPNCILWVTNDRIGKMLLGLLREGRVHTHNAEPLTYVIDGKTLRMPLALKKHKGLYKKPHWIPACLRVVPNTRAA